jgi:hypothetical protein
MSTGYQPALWMKVQTSAMVFVMISSGNDEAISFNDDSSPHTRRTGATKVCVNAQVQRELPLDWYYRIIGFFPDIPGELKSSLISSKLGNLPREVQAAIWRGLSRVRIHIVDPRPYYRRVGNLLRKVWKRTDAPEKLRQMEAQGLPKLAGFLHGCGKR